MDKITIEFNVEFGSDHQERNFFMILKTMMEVIKMMVEDGHSDNKISYVIDTHDGYKTTKK